MGSGAELSKIDLDPQPKDLHHSVYGTCNRECLYSNLLNG